MAYVLSVVIATRNRFAYLKECLLALCAMNEPDMEVVVQDNSDNHKEIEEFVAGLGYSNIKYFYSSGQLSQQQNSELAVERATGEYVSYIGDDDCICASLVELAKAMKKHRIDACNYGISTYNWPDLVAQKPELYYFRSPDQSGKIQTYDPRQVLLRRLRKGIHEIYDLPRVYHGIVSSRLLNQIKENAGSYFPGPSPDMANATGCALYAENFYSIDVVAIVSGFGGKSAGGMGKQKKHRGPIKGNFQLQSDIEEIWDERIPKLWMADTIWPESAISTLKACGRKELIAEIDFEDIYAKTILNDPGSMKEVWRCVHSVKSCVKTCGKLLIRLAKLAVVKSGLYGGPKGGQVYREQCSLQDAVNIQNKNNEAYHVEQLFDMYFAKMRAESAEK